MYYIEGNYSDKNKSLWSAVKIAKDINVLGMPEGIHLENLIISEPDLAQTFANYFEKIYIRHYIHDNH